MRHSENHSHAGVHPVLAQNNKIAWEHIYDKYAVMMYGFILDLTHDEKVAGEIYRETFVEIKDKKSHSRLQIDICNKLLLYTSKTAAKYLEEINLPSRKKLPRTTNLPLNNLWSFINGYNATQG